MKRRILPGILWAAVLVTAGSFANATTRTWNGSIDQNWFSAGNWDPSDAHPQAGDTVIVNSGSILLTNTTSELAAFSISNAVLTFTNWTTALRADDLTVLNDARLTLAPAFYTGEMSNRIWVICTNFTLEDGGVIDADEKGFRGGLNSSGHGPGAGVRSGGWCGGGGHGGKGGNSQHSSGRGGVENGSPSNPGPGSSSGGDSTWGGEGGSGGGAIHIDVAERAIIRGLISANGGSPASGNSVGGGAGGGILIDCGYLDGSSSGMLQANGGGGAGTGGGRGGGGRIVLRYAPQQQRNHTPDLELSVRVGVGGYVDGGAEIGTIYLSDDQLMAEDIVGYEANIYGVTEWHHESLSFTNRHLELRESGVQMTVTNTLFIGSNAFLLINIASSQLECRELIVTDNGQLEVWSGATNSVSPDYGALVNVTGDIRVDSNAWIYTTSDLTNGGSVLIKARNVLLTGGLSGGIDASGRGFGGQSGYGPGATDGSQYGGGGAYGGKGGVGGNSNPAGGIPYGSPDYPIHAGSGGGGAYAGFRVSGGGLIRIDAEGSIVANGVIRANGGNGLTSGNGGGSGGGILISCTAFSGDASGALEARGGNGWSNGGGGGGGRIAIWRGVPAAARERYLSGHGGATRLPPAYIPQYQGLLSVAGGSGFEEGDDGSVFFFMPSGSLFMFK